MNSLHKHFKKIGPIIAGLLLGISIFAPSALADSMMATPSPSSSSAASADELKGEQVYNQLQSGATTCAKLTDDDFDVLGDFYMGRMMGSSHDAMNQEMSQQLGSAGERQAHIAMGKRLSGCDTNASYPAGVNNYTDLAWMGGMMGNNGVNMMSGYAYGSWAWVGMMLFWLVLVIVIIAGVFWFRRRGTVDSTASLDVLKQRYAKGEIDKKEFDEKRKDLIV